MLDGYRNVDLPTWKKLPVQLNVPKLLITTAYQPGMAEVQRAMVDLTMKAFYYLLWVREYTIRGSWNKTKQTVQFKYKDVSFFKKNTRCQLRCLPHDATADIILTANGATLKLDNQENGWKGVCVYHKYNGKRGHCPVCALARCYLHLCNIGADSKTFLLASYNDKGQGTLKVATTALDYPMAKGIPVDRINTHSLWSGGTNTLFSRVFIHPDPKNGSMAGSNFQRIYPLRACMFLCRNVDGHEKEIQFCQHRGQCV
jgi:hypothetical protein